MKFLPWSCAAFTSNLERQMKGGGESAQSAVRVTPEFNASVNEAVSREKLENRSEYIRLLVARYAEVHHVDLAGHWVDISLFCKFAAAGWTYDIGLMQTVGIVMLLYDHYVGRGDGWRRKPCNVQDYN